MVDVFILDITNLEVETYLNRLPSNFTEEVLKYNEPNQRKRSFFGWYLLYCLLRDRGIETSKMKIKHNNYGKPIIENFNFNITHSHNLVAVAISSNEVGIDVEYLDNRDQSKIAKTIMSDEEYLKYLDDNQLFYIIWTQKEAYLKWKGTGIQLSALKDKKIKIEADTKLIDLSEDERYCLSVVPGKSKINFVEILNEKTKLKY